MGKAFLHGNRESGSGLPKISYTGDYRFTAEDGKNWRLELLTSGELTFERLGNAAKGVDVFLVGGGSGAPYTGTYKGGGGAGGYTRTAKNLILPLNTPITAVVGAGSDAATEGWDKKGDGPADGGTTSFAGYAAAGGYGQTEHTNYQTGCTGGTGGQIYGKSTDEPAVDGADGSATGLGQRSTPGPNGETGTTGEFGDETALLYSNGGCYGGEPRPNSGDAGRSSEDGNVGTAGAAGIIILRNARG